MSAPTLALIVPTFNRPEMVRRAVRSALRQRGVDEVIVVDDASDPALDLGALADPRLKVLVHPGNLGVSAARNTGAAAARASHLMFLDDDDVLLPFAAAQMRRWIAQTADPRAVVVGALMRGRPGRGLRILRPPSSQAGEIWGMDAHLLRPGQSFATKQAAAIPRTLLAEVGGWDEKLRSRVTSEFFFRLCQAAPVVGKGWPIYWLNRGDHAKITGDLERRERSVAYIRRKHAALLADPDRSAAFERNHAEVVARTQAARSG